MHLSPKGSFPEKHSWCIIRVAVRALLMASNRKIANGFREPNDVASGQSETARICACVSARRSVGLS